MIRLHRLVLIALACISALAGAAASRAQAYPESLFQGMRWRMIGPFRGGRTRGVAGVASEPNVFYIGVVDGGIWKSDDYGRTWKPIFDREPTQSIGAIAVARSNPNVIYAASGEGLARPDLSVGDGIYKSTDAGKTWAHLGLRDGQQIPALAIDPRDPNRLFAAVLGHPYGPNQERGIFRSTDGGETWQKVLYRDENTGGCDVAIDLANPLVVYACLWQERQGPWEYGNQYSGTGGLYKSIDGGTTWHPLTNGLPKDLVQVHIAIAPSEPNRLYAVASTPHVGGYESGKGLGFYRSDDVGESWHVTTTDPRPVMLIGGGDLPELAVDPKNPDVVYSTSIVTMRSTDGGKTWIGIRGAPGGDDYQNIWINPNNPKVILLVGDQGALVSVNSGRTWSSWYNQPTAQIYHVQASNTFPYRVCGGQQESGSVCIATRGNDGEITFREWHPVGAMEYGYVAPDPLDPEIVYGAGRNEVSKFHWSTGQVQNVTPIPELGKEYRVDRTQPLIFSPIDPHILYYAANKIFKTTDGGNSWQAISPDLARAQPGIPASLGNLAAKDPKAAKQRGVVYALGPSFKNANTLWAGTDDGLIWVTHDGGKNWKNVTPAEIIPWSKVTQITASHFDDESAYASVSRFRIDDLRPYLYRTHDGGKTWQRITNGLAENAPVDTVREDPARKGLLFAGTESGVWVSFDDGDDWQSLELNLPHTSMRDLWIHDHDLIVATHGRGFWVLDDITPLEQLTRRVAQAPAHLFQPEPAYRVRRDTNTDTPLPPDEPAGKNPPDGAIIDYYLGARAAGPVTLDILDAHGRLVRRYASTDQPAITEAQLEKQLIPLYWVRLPKILSAEAGMHRWVWDLHYPAPVVTRHEYPISAVPHDTPRGPLGPRALPGSYTVRLTVDGKTYAAPLTVKMDPRVNASPAALDQQFNLEMSLASLLTRSSEAIFEAESLRQQLQKLSGQARGPLAQAIAALKQKGEAALGSSENTIGGVSTEPTLDHINGQTGELYGEIDRADAAPTPAQQKAAAEIERDAGAAIAHWKELMSRDLAALNRELRAAGLPEVHPEAKRPAEE